MIVEAFQADWPVREDLHDVVSSSEGIGISEHQQRALLGTVYQACGRFEHRDTGTLGADQCPGDMKAVFRQQLIQVIARNTARNIRKACTDLVSILIT